MCTICTVYSIRRKEENTLVFSHNNAHMDSESVWKRCSLTGALEQHCTGTFVLIGKGSDINMDVSEILNAVTAKGQRSFLKPEEVAEYDHFVVVKGRTQEFDSDYSETGKRMAVLADVDCMDSDGNVVSKKTLDVSRWIILARHFKTVLGAETDKWEGSILKLKMGTYTDSRKVERTQIIPADVEKQAKAEGC